VNTCLVFCLSLKHVREVPGLQSTDNPLCGHGVENLNVPYTFLFRRKINFKYSAYSLAPIFKNIGMINTNQV
jgi:hypothetical protein